MNIQMSLDELMRIDGAQCAAVVDASSGMMLGNAGSGINMEIAAAGNTEMVRAKLKTMKALGIKDKIEDIMITLDTAYHILRPVVAYDGIFVYMVLDKSRANLALARRKISDIEKAMDF